LGTKYSSQSISGYNSSPPSDDGTQSESNKTKWATVKTKLGDPVKSAVEAINSALVTALDQSVRSVSASDSTVAGDHNRTIQIASTITASITISLGDAATMAAGYIVTVANQSNVACVVDRVTASNTINGSTSSISIAPLESITFIVNSATNGYVVKNRGFAYQEGTWTPVIGGSGGTSGQAYTTQNGRYVKVGKLVTCWFTATLSTEGTITSGVQIQGLPFTSAAFTNDMLGSALRFSGLATNWVNVIASVGQSSTAANVTGCQAAATNNETALTASDIGNTSAFRGCIVYEAAA
jgi:hypothetical protein